MDEKLCPQCGKVLPISAFPIQRDGDRRVPHSYCRPCGNARRAAGHAGRKVKSIVPRKVVPVPTGRFFGEHHCPKCDLWKLVTEFGVRTNQYGRTKLQSWCRACRAASTSGRRGYVPKQRST